MQSPLHACLLSPYFLPRFYTILFYISSASKENDVPFYQDNKLAETLSKLQIGDTIPPELYDVVAEILVFVDDMDKMKAKLQQADMLS